MTLIEKMEAGGLDPCRQARMFLANYTDEQKAWDENTDPSWHFWYLSYTLARTIDNLKKVTNVCLQAFGLVSHQLPPEMKVVILGLVTVLQDWADDYMWTGNIDEAKALIVIRSAYARNKITTANRNGLDAVVTSGLLGTVSNHKPIELEEACDYASDVMCRVVSALEKEQWRTDPDSERDIREGINGTTLRYDSTGISFATPTDHAVERGQ